MSTSPRIERGAALLDQRAPGWTTKIDLDTLDLEYSDCCVLGQVYGDYYDGVCKLDGELGFHNANRYGFVTYGAETFSALTAKWRRYIEKRRAAS